MAIFLVFSILFHLTMSKCLDPLLYGLPRSVQAQELAIQAGEGGEETGLATTKGSHGSSNGTNGKSAGLKQALSGGSVQKPGNVLARFLMPWKHADYATLRKLVPSDDDMDFENQYTEQVEAMAYLPPSVSSATPTLWIPRDPAGVSRQEVALTSKVVPITDEGA
ncbi:hypothetical protein RF55_26384, partial [Lasius niger]